MSNKVIMTICIDRELIPLVDELKARRGFSAFVQEALRSARVIIESESIEKELADTQEAMNNLMRKADRLNEKLEAVKAEEIQKDAILDLELRLIELNNQRSSLEIWENLPINKRPAEWLTWHKERLAVADKLKAAGYDFSRLRRDKE